MKNIVVVCKDGEYANDLYKRTIVHFDKYVLKVCRISRTMYAFDIWIRFVSAYEYYHTDALTGIRDYNVMADTLWVELLRNFKEDGYHVPISQPNESGDN